MKASLESSYEFKTVVKEERRLLEGLSGVKKDYIVFSSYRRNDGRRRLEDIKNVIDVALEKIGHCNSDEASKVYLKTLKTVTMQTRWAAVLESLSEYSHS